MNERLITETLITLGWSGTHGVSLIHTEYILLKKYGSSRVPQIVKC